MSPPAIDALTKKEQASKILLVVADILFLNIKSIPLTFANDSRDNSITTQSLLNLIKHITARFLRN